MKDIKKIVQEQLQKVLSEGKVHIEDRSTSRNKRVDIINMAWEKGLSDLEFNKADGIVTDEGSLVDIYMNNGDKITWAGRYNPSTAGIFLNGEKIKEINSKEKFSAPYWELVKQAYSSSSSNTRNAGV